MAILYDSILYVLFIVHLYMHLYDINMHLYEFIIIYMQFTFTCTCRSSEDKYQLHPIKADLRLTSLPASRGWTSKRSSGSTYSLCDRSFDSKRHSRMIYILYIIYDMNWYEYIYYMNWYEYIYMIGIDMIWWYDDQSQTKHKFHSRKGDSLELTSKVSTTIFCERRQCLYVVPEA